jgi:hypothetical protein
MTQIQKPKRHRGPAGGRQESLAADPRDPNIAHATGSPVAAALPMLAGRGLPAATAPRRLP